MRKKSKQPDLATEKILEYLMPFASLIANQNLDVRIEAQTNKEFHMGPKEFEYIPTVTGHVPLR